MAFLITTLSVTRLDPRDQSTPQAVTALHLIGDGKRGWRVEHAPAKGVSASAEVQEGATESEEFDFCVIASGMYGWPPHLPLARGHEDFKGKCDRVRARSCV